MYAKRISASLVGTANSMTNHWQPLQNHPWPSLSKISYRTRCSGWHGSFALFYFEGVVRPANLMCRCDDGRFRCQRSDTRHQGSHLFRTPCAQNHQERPFPVHPRPRPNMARSVDVTALAATGKPPVKFNISAFRKSTIIPHRRTLTCVCQRDRRR
jgi:hypothetical protein